MFSRGGHSAQVQYTYFILIYTTNKAHFKSVAYNCDESLSLPEIETNIRLSGSERDFNAFFSLLFPLSQSMFPDVSLLVLQQYKCKEKIDTF